MSTVTPIDELVVWRHMDVGSVIDFDSLTNGLDSLPTLWKSRDTILFLELALEHDVSCYCIVEFVDAIGEELLFGVVG